jgi:hypothetical protein
MTKPSPTPIASLILVTGLAGLARPAAADPFTQLEREQQIDRGGRACGSWSSSLRSFVSGLSGKRNNHDPRSSPPAWFLTHSADSDLGDDFIRAESSARNSAITAQFYAIPPEQREERLNFWAADRGEPPRYGTSCSR